MKKITPPRNKSTERSLTALDVRAGSSAPLGATPAALGANFSVFSRHAHEIELLLFDGVDNARPA
jgi:pullulanase/glycogen debranching enzyme